MAICETCGNDYDKADHAEREAIASVLMHARRGGNNDRRK